jgi:four helix bundle protein
MELAKEVYQLSTQLPESEKFGLISQMRRSAVSIPSNIAEGRQRRTRRDYAQFLRIADGSASELETQILLSVSIFNLQGTDRALSLLHEVQKMLGTILMKL